MTKTLLGNHVVIGSRDNYNGTLYRGVISFEHGAIDPAVGQVKPDCFTVWRNINQYGTDNADHPPGFDNFNDLQAAANAEHWWRNTPLRAQWDAHPSKAQKLGNEVGANNEQVVSAWIAFEKRMIQLNEEAGRPYTFLIQSLANDTPDWNSGLWQEVIAPFIVYAWQRGHIYSRHAYCDNGPYASNRMIIAGKPSTPGTDRPFQEFRWFIDNYGYCGPMVLGEVGFVTFPGADRYVQELTAYDQYAINYEYKGHRFADSCGFMACFTDGEWWNANKEDANPQLNQYLESHPYTEWMPEFNGPPKEQPMECKPRTPYKRKYLVSPQNATLAEWLEICAEAYANKNTVSFSHDDAGHAPNVISNTAVLYGIPPEAMQTYIDWYSEHYPQTFLEFAEGTPPPADLEIINIVDDLPKHPTKKYLTRPLSGITTLTVHHTVSPPDRSIDSIANYHVNSNGWPGIGYHFVVKDNGSIFQTNHLTTKSYHTGSAAAPGDENEISVGISLQGDFTISPPPKAQQDAARALVTYLKREIPSVTAVLGHRQMPGASTACPGNTYKSWLPYVAGGEIEEHPTPVPPTPLPGKQVNIRKYFEPSGEYGRKYVFRFPDGSTQPQQLRKIPDGTICLFKGDGQTIDGKFVYDYERFYFDAQGNLRRKEDTSVGGRAAYDQNNAIWLPGTITEGVTYINHLTLTNYDRVSCKKLGDLPTTDYLTFVKFHPTWTSPQNSNITLQNVCQLEWRKSPGGKIEETYYLTEGILYGAWNNGAIYEWADGQQNIDGKLWGCGE